MGARTLPRDEMTPHVYDDLLAGLLRDLPDDPLGRKRIRLSGDDQARIQDARVSGGAVTVLDLHTCTWLRIRWSECGSVGCRCAITASPGSQP